MIVLGLLLRLYFVLFTGGSYDAQIWEGHARGVREHGLAGYYHANGLMNHPPFIAETAALLLRFAEKSGIPFRVSSGWLRFC